MSKLALGVPRRGRGRLSGRFSGWACVGCVAASAVSLFGADAPASVNADAPRIEFAEPVHDFGEITSGAKVTHSFEFSNTGSSTLEITKVNTSCGCTTAGEWDRVLEPGQKGAIPIEFNSGSFSGNIMKTVTVLSNDPERSTVVLQIKGNIWTPIEITPRSVVFQYDSGSPTGETKVIKIRNNLDTPLVLSAPEWKQEAFKVELEELKPGKEFALNITTLPPVGTGTISAPITLKTTLTNTPRLSVHALAVERQPFSISPSRIYLPAEPLAEPNRPLVTIRKLTDRSVTLSDPAINVPGVEVKLEEVEPGKVFRLTPVFPEGLEIKPGQRVELSVKTTDPRRPVIQIPVLARAVGRPVTRVVPAAPVDGNRPAGTAVPTRRPVRTLSLPGGSADIPSGTE